MNKKWSIIGMLIITALVLSACGGGAGGAQEFDLGDYANYVEAAKAGVNVILVEKEAYLGGRVMRTHRSASTRRA